MNHFVADLHNHTTASDGEYTPAELVRAAHALGLQAIGVTDHDTLQGLDEALATGARLGLCVLPGVEVSLRFRRAEFVGTLHYLLYIPLALLTDVEFRAQATAVFAQGRGAALVQARVAAINAKFGPQGKWPLLQRPLTADEVMAQGQNITRRHFAQVLRRHHGLEEAQINQLIANDSPAYVPSGIEPGLLTPLLRAYPQLVRVLAHPAAGSFPGKSLYNEVLPPLAVVERLMPEFLDERVLGLDGLEVYYPGHTPEHKALMATWARRYGLLPTGGSDCHDRTKRPLGVAGVNQTELDVLWQRLA